jgi:hypothetical protein
MLYLDENVMFSYRNIIGKGNVSQKIEDYLINCINVSKSNSSAISIQLLKKEIDNLTNQQSKVSSELTTKMQQLELIQKTNEEIEKKRLEDEKMKIEKETLCINCGNLVPTKDLDKYKFGLGSICRTCFLTSNAELVKKWDGKQ